MTFMLGLVCGVLLMGGARRVTRWAMPRLVRSALRAATRRRLHRVRL